MAENEDEDEDECNDETHNSKKIAKIVKESAETLDIIKIHQLFSSNEYTETTQGYKMECPDCGLQGGRTEGFILFPETNSAYCHSSGKWFTILETYALKKKLIRCLDGREKNEPIGKKILGGELFTLTLDEFKNEFGTDMYNKLIGQLKIRKSIELPGNNRYVSDFCDELGDIYKSRNVLFFRGTLGKIYEIHRYTTIKEDGKEYKENGFREVESNRFITLAEMFIRPWTTIFTKSGNSMTVNKSMTQGMASQALASPNLQNKIPTIVRIFDIQIPILNEKKLTFPKKGYDNRFESWLPYNAPQIKEDMFTLEEGKRVIDKIFEEFCFASEKDRTHAIAAFITPFLRGLFPKFSTRTPVFIYMANRERAGKDYCAGCSGILYEGVNVEEPAISNDEKGSSNANEEIRKKIMACMMQGKKRFHSANNKGLLNNSVLEGVTTAETWSDRVLGQSKNITFDNEMDYSLSGNLGIRLTPDLANRARIVNLHLIDEDANARKFKNPNLHEWILENRGMIISALYALIKKWNNDGRPDGSIPFTSFPHWARICGGIMESAGYDNPCKTDKTAIISLDSETEEMKMLFETCCTNHPDEWLTKNEIQSIVENEAIMPYLNFSDKGDQIKFGMKIDKFANRILSEIIMTVDSLEQRASRRKFKFSKNTGIFTGMNGHQRKDEAEKNGNLGNVKTTFVCEAEKHDSISISHKTNKDDEKKTEKMEKSGNGGKLGNVPYTVPYLFKRYTAGNVTLPKLPTLPNSEILLEQPKNFKNCETLEEFSQKYKDLIKKEQEEEREKSDRELQFYESPETSTIVEQCTKEQVLEWIKNNPKASFKVMYEQLGNGCIKYASSLIDEGLVKPIEDGWEAVNGME